MNSLFFPFFFKDAFTKEGSFLCQNSLTITEQITITLSTCSLLVFSLQALYLIPTRMSHNTLRSTVNVLPKQTTESTSNEEQAQPKQCQFAKVGADFSWKTLI